MYCHFDRLTLENLSAEFKEINDTVENIDKQLKASPEEIKEQFEAFIKVNFN